MVGRGSVLKAACHAAPLEAEGSPGEGTGNGGLPGAAGGAATGVMAYGAWRRGFTLRSDGRGGIKRINIRLAPLVAGAATEKYAQGRLAVSVTGKAAPEVPEASSGGCSAEAIGCRWCGWSGRRRGNGPAPAPLQHRCCSPEPGHNGPCSLFLGGRPGCPPW